VIPQRSRYPEDQVVARLVGQEQRRRGFEEGGGIFEAANVHTRIVGTAGATTIRPLVILDRTIARMLPAVPKPLVHMLAQRYIAGPTLEDACRVVKTANAEHKLGTIDVLGEEIRTRDEARAIAGAYRDVFETIERQGLDSNVSVKLTGLGLKLDYDLCRENLESVVREAARRNNFVRIDMEDSSTTDDTLRLYRDLREAGHENLGVVLQAYLRRTLDDIRSLADLRPSVRICKGIYVEPPELAYQGYEEVRSNFIRALEALLDADCYVGIATHDEWLVSEGRRIVARRGLGRDEYEFQMLYGIAEARGNRLVREGHRLRIYVPFGEHWYAYSLRRLQENPKIAGYIAADTLGRLVPRRNGSA
jgi:proline dehydrogenase